MRLYLAELVHTAQTPGVVPLAIGYLATTIQAHRPDIDVGIFTDPDQLIDALKVRPPDVLGFSLHLWSERLSAYCVEQARQLCPEVFIIAGGPSVDERTRGYDLTVMGEGESALLNLLKDFPDHRGESFHGTRSNLLDIPSPYLTGWLDPFLERGCVPVIQSMRGCPYGCQFCVSGKPGWNRLYPFSLNRVYAELDYARTHAKTDYVVLADENLGILKDRDVALARHIREMHDTTGWPRRLYAYTAKIVTDHVRQVADVLAPLNELCMSFQTMDDDVRKAIGRTNQRYEEFLSHIAWAKERGIITSTEMIFGLPGETITGYRRGLEQLLTSGVDRVYSYNLKLLPGSYLASQVSRDHYHYQTRWRIPDRAYGCYAGAVLCEAEEVVVGSGSFTLADYLRMRRYGLFLELGSGRGYLSELIQMMGRCGLPGQQLLGFLSEHQMSQYPRLRDIVSEYDAAASAELFDTPEACRQYVIGWLSRSEDVPEVKLNYVYTDRIVGDGEARRELVSVIRTFVASVSVDCIEVMTYVDEGLDTHIVNFRPKELG